jgi:hypothetical protein
LVMRMSFEHWLETGWLKAHKPTAREMAELGTRGHHTN